jgi:hypothetical protein
MIDSKPTNPKDVIGSGKLPLELVPDTAPIYMATSFLEGALKYGRFNWRIAGVRASIYVAAARRHLDKWWNGEDVDKCIDPETGEDTGTGVHHPPRADVAKLIASLDATVARLKAMFAEHHPRQYTIADSPDRRESVYNAIADQRPEWVPQTKLERMVFGGTPRTVATLDGCKRCDKPFGQPHEQNCHEAYG